MTREADKARELLAVLELIRRLDLQGQVDGPTPRERPDFELRFRDGTSVGIEVTELADSRIASGEAAVTRLRKAVQAGLAELGVSIGLGLSIGEGFASELARDGRHVRDHADGIVRLVQEHIRAGRQPRRYRNDFLRANGAPFVLEAWIGESPGKIYTSGTAYGRREPFVQQCIDAKNAKIAEYRASLPGRPIWLLLVAGVAWRSAVWSVVLEGHTYSSRFDRTFYIDAFDSRSIELAPSIRTPSNT
jgi:hypothetical protein